MRRGDVDIIQVFPEKQYFTVNGVIMHSIIEFAIIGITIPGCKHLTLIYERFAHLERIEKLKLCIFRDDFEYYRSEITSQFYKLLCRFVLGRKSTKNVQDFKENVQKLFEVQND
jgi:hypothetical protein